MDPRLVDWLRNGDLPDDRPLAGERDRPRWIRVLVPAAALPWLVVAALAWSGAAQQDHAPDDPEPAQRPPPASGSPPAAPPPPVGAPPDRGVTLDARLAARAAAAVRLQVTGHGGVHRYVDLAAAEHAEAAGDVVVVTVLAVLLEGDAERWTTTRAVRFGVPFRLVAGEPVPLGEPWPLAGPATPEPDLGWDALDDPALVEQVHAAVERAGFSDLEDLEVDAAPELAGVLRASVHARAPGWPEAMRHALWLRSAPAVGVLGSRPAQEDAP